MDIQKRELWDRLENEPERAYRAFESFMSLPSSERTLVAAYRHFVGNPDAPKPSDTWTAWAHRFAWKERARAYDAYIDKIRRKSMEKAIEQEAAEQARQAERARYHLNELMTLGYVKTVEYLEELDPSSMRFSDVAQVIRLHMDAVEKLGSGDEGMREGDWTEEDDAQIAEIWKKIQARKDSEQNAQSPAEPDSASDGSDEGRSEESEGDET